MHMGGHPHVAVNGIVPTMGSAKSASNFSPKVRCMQLIGELEREGRGVYTGSMGYLDRDGDLDLNILIRTLAVSHGVATLRAGSGIVADSDIGRELEETRAKARGVLRALSS